MSWKYGEASLLEAAEFVEQIPEEQFNIHHWWLPKGEAFDDDRNVMYRVADGPCGCPIGHMIQKRLFGFDNSLIKHPSTRDNNKLPYEYRQEIFVRIGDAVGVGYQLAEFMFDSYSYPDIATREMVVRRIRFVAEERERFNLRKGK